MRQAACIGGGTTEMARNVISERVLGMPRERTVDRDVAFRDVPKGPAGQSLTRESPTAGARAPEAEVPAPAEPPARRPATAPAVETTTPDGGWPGREHRPDGPGERSRRSPTRATAALFITGLFVFTAIQGQQIARGWLAKELTGTNSGLGGVYLGFGLPMLLVTPIGGVLADRTSKRMITLAATGLLTASSAWVAIALMTDSLAYWMLVVTAGIQAVGFSIYGPTRVAFTAEVVPRYLLPNAIALTQTSLNATRIVAPTLAGALIGVPAIGSTGVYIGGTILLVVAIGLAMTLPDTPVRTAPNRSAYAEFTDGWRYLRGNTQLFLLVLISTVVIVVGMPYLAFLPNVADDIFDKGAAGYGIMNGVAAVAALAVSLWVAGSSKLSTAWTVQAVSGVAFGAGLVFIALSPNFFVVLVAVAIVGGAVSGFQSMNNTLVLTESTTEYHGRRAELPDAGLLGLRLRRPAHRPGRRRHRPAGHVRLHGRRGSDRHVDLPPHPAPPTTVLSPLARDRMSMHLYASLVRRFWDDIWGAGKLDEIEAIFTNPYIRHTAGGNDSRTWTQMRHDVVQYRRTLRGASVHFDDQAVVGQKVWTRLTASGISIDTQEPVTMSFLQLHRIEDNRLAEVWLLSAPGVNWNR